MDDTGSAVPLLTGVLAVLVLLTLGVARLGGAIGDAARAQTAADAAALAAVEGGEPAARRLARLNGGEMISCTCSADPVEVLVEVDGARATARASRLP